jgi:chromosome partitioning protein
MSIAGGDDLHRIVVLNPKGGSGKTTLSTNLASIYALRKPPPTLIDCDPQGFCSRWLDRRTPDRPPIYGIDAFRTGVSGSPTTAASVLEQIPSDSRVAIFDLPAAISLDELYTHTHFADSILIPIVPSEIDIHSAAQLISELLLDVQLDRRDNKLAIVANRVRANTRSYQMLRRFLSSLKIPVISALRDSQAYVQAAADGVGICEMPPYRVRDDLISWKAILSWLDHWQSRRLDAEIAEEFDRLIVGDEEIAVELPGRLY